MSGFNAGFGGCSLSGAKLHAGNRFWSRYCFRKGLPGGYKWALQHTARKTTSMRNYCGESE
jgi:hypothetical protein